MATTLKQFAQESRDRYQALKEAALGEYSTLSADFAAAQEDHGARVAEYAALGNEIASKRAAMSGDGLMPSDIEALAEELRDLLIAQRAKYAELLEAEEEAARLGRRKDEVESERANLTKRVTEAEVELSAAKERDAQHTAWKQSVSDGAVTAIKDKATAVLDARSAGSEPPEEDEALIWKAKRRVEGDIPEVLRTRARERGAQIETKRSDLSDYLKGVEDRLGTQRAAAEGAAGLAAQRRVEFERAESAFKSVVLHSQNRYGQAIALLASVTGSAALTAAESARIAALNLAADADAVVKEKARDVANDAVIAKQLEIEEALVDALVADINADPEDNAAVQARRAELTPLETALSSAESAYDATMRDAMDQWEGAVPNHVWNNLLSYDRAVSLLTAIKDADAAALSAAMDAAQSVLAAALEAEEKAARLSDALEATAALAGAQLGDLNNAYQSQMFSRVRGDA